MSSPQTFTINAYNGEKWYHTTHTLCRHPMGVSGQLHGPGKASGNLCAETCWYPEPIESRALGRPVTSARKKFLIQKRQALMREMGYLNKERTVFHISRSYLKIFDIKQVPYRGAKHICRHRTKIVRPGDRDLCTTDLKVQAHLNSTDDLFPTPRNHNVSATMTHLLRLVKNHPCSFKQRKEPTKKTAR